MRASTENTRENSRKWHANHRDEENAKSRAWQKENREKRAAYMRKWQADSRASDPEEYSRRVRRTVLKRRYGITPEDYEAMLLAQCGHCALCDRTPAQERYGHLNVDHCHATGKVRGLLCTPHNHALGKLGDSEAALLRALAYIRSGI
jgi:hypothetical protein